MANRVTSVLFVLALLLAGASATRELQGNSYSGGGSCTAVGISGQMGTVRNVWGEAVANAFVYTCSIDGSTDGATVIDRMTRIFHDYAQAAVHVYAKAVAKCTTTGNTYGCANARAAADKEVEATADLYASAVANAVNRCPKCDPTAWAEISTSLIVKITAAARVRVRARVCAVGDDRQLAIASQECWASSIANACAFAFAKAVARGGCLEEVAKAHVEAYVNVHVEDPTCECEGWKLRNNRFIWDPPSNFHQCTFHDYAL